MVAVSENILRSIMPNAGDRLTPHIPFIQDAFHWGKIVTINNAAMFLAHLAHESGEYRYTREIADGSAYEGRADLGNTQPGDGVRYPGRGGIQVTGRAAARACGQFFGVDFENHPELMERPEWATHVSVWFWNVYKTVNYQGKNIAYLPLFAEMNWMKATTKGVNGGYNGLTQRCFYWNTALKTYGQKPVDIGDETASVLEFQHRMGIPADGVPGGQTAYNILKFLERA